jgi:opacity protein-like surface antigen
MRTLKTMLLVAVLAVSASAAHAGTMTFGLNGDAAIPMGDFGDAFKVGFGGGVYGDYWIKDDYAFGIDVNGDFFRAKDDLETALTVGGDKPKITSDLIGFNVHGVWSPKMQSGIQPWVTYGVGLSRISTKVKYAAGEGKDDVNKVGFNVGVGADWKAGTSMKIGPQVKYNYVATEGSSTTYVTAGLHLTFMTSGATK